MSGKNKKKTNKILWLLPALLVLAVAVVLCMVAGENLLPSNLPSGTEAPDMTTENNTGCIIVPEENGTEAFTLEQGLQIMRYGSYIGVYMEDGSDEFVRDVMMIVVTNTGEKPVQYARIILSGEPGDAEFNLTTLKPGDSMVVLESNRKTFTEGDVYTQARAENVAFFLEPPTLQEDRVEIQPLEGGFNIRNVSGEDITGEIAVYFKDAAGGMYYGGITYVCRIGDGLQKDEVKQVMSSNFTASGSEVVFIRIGE